MEKTAIEVRLIKASDFGEVEELTRLAFWNQHAPGCNEHYLVHLMREHPDFCPELSFVAVSGGKIVGNIMFTRSKVTAADGTTINTLTFGPLSVLPSMQRKGIGSALVRHAIKLIDPQQFPAVIIFGNPSNYISQGFVSSKKIGVGVAEGVYPTAMLALPLDPLPFKARTWVFSESHVFSINDDEAERFDRLFPPMAKEYRYSQEEFAILSNSLLRNDRET